MSTRDAMKITLKLLFEWLPEENGKKYEWTQEGIDNAVELMHDDDTFFRELLDFLAAHLDTFAENYGLEFKWII